MLLVCSQFAGAIGSRIGGKIGEWQAAKQKRTAITTSMIDYIKDIKLMGMANTVMARIQDSRVVEIAKGNSFRWILVYFNATGKISFPGQNSWIPLNTNVLI